MTLDQLRYFLAVCQYSGVSSAAEALNISQPSISNAIANLEKEFGVALFTRQRKRLIITKEGMDFLHLAKNLVSQADSTIKTMHTIGRTNHVLRLGVPPMIGSLVLPILYRKHFQSYPQLQVHIVENGSSELKKLLAEDQIDMAFLPHTHPFDGDFGSALLTELQNVCCVNKAHPLAKQSSVCFEELTNEPLVLFKNSFFQTERILSEFSKRSLTPYVLLDTAQLSTMQNMIAGNTAIGFMFEFLLKSTPELVSIPLEPPMKTKVSLVWKKSSHLSGDMKNLIEFIKTAERSL